MPKEWHATTGRTNVAAPSSSSRTSREQASLEALDKAFRVSLQRYFRRRAHSRAEIDDMVQQVFERLLRRGNVAGIERLGGYVFQTASSVLADSQRRQRADPSDPSAEISDYADVDFTPERVLLGRERLAHVTAILLELPERTRVIFVLRRLEGMKYLDIASRLGISVSAVEKHMERAVARLTERMEEQ